MNNRYIVGQKIEELTLLKFRRNGIWEVLCSCGIALTVSSRHLKRKKSCGCRSISNRFKKVDKRRYILNRRYGHYKQSADRRNLKFELTIEQFSNFVENSCAYCNLPPHKDYFNYKTKESIKLNGIDRIDSDKGYSLENCNSACTFCNYAKSDLSELEFRNWLKWVKENA